MDEKLANPAPLGLMGFGMTTVLLNLRNAGLWGVGSMILAMGLFYSTLKLNRAVQKSRRSRYLVLGLLCWASVPGGTTPVWAADGESELSWYGYFKLDMARDSAVPSHGNFVMYVKPHKAGEATSTLSVTARQTRLGLNAVRGTMKGKLEVDFYNASAENRNAVMLRKAYVETPVGSVHLRAGQAADVISPLVPATINYSVAWGAGNIGYRRPQMQVYQQTEAYYWGLALARTIGADLDADGVNDGDASGVPSVQGRLAFSLRPGHAAVTIGGSAHYGRLSSSTEDNDYSSWSVNGDVKLKLQPRLVILGELYTGSNLGTYNGAILNGDAANGLSSRGGWANVQYGASELLTLSVGGAVEDVEDADLGAAADARSRNAVLFANGLYEIAPGVKLGLEVSNWTTEYVNVSAGNGASPSDTRLQWTVQGSF